jgi:hypothetical protein
MELSFTQLCCMVATTLLLAAGAAFAATEDLGGGFLHHGVATPVSNHRGIVATVDGNGKDVVLIWLFDHSGGYALLMVDAETGKCEQFPMPFASDGDCPYSSILSTGNKFYTHFNSHFVEFDPVKRAFTFCAETVPQMAMGMTEDDQGVIWSVTYPASGVASFNPKTRVFRDYGHVYDQNWQQYQRYAATDDAGWLYFGLGNTATQIIALDPQSGKATPLVPEADRGKGMAYVYRDVNGKVYGQYVEGASNDWYELYKGEIRKIGKLETRNPKPIITGSQGLVHSEFPDGKRLTDCDLTERKLTIEDPKAGKTTTLDLTYTSEGAHTMGVAAAPDGTICGGTAFPMRFFSYNPRTDTWINRECYGQWNTIVRQGDSFFVGAYSGGYLLQWRPDKPWVPTQADDKTCNPAYLYRANPSINRPHKLFAHPDGNTIIMAGTPDYGYTGGGLLFWDRKTETGTLIEHTAILPEHSTMSMAALPDGKLLGGTTTSAGTGGEQKAKQAELYIMDMATKQVEWHEPVFPGVQSYIDLCSAPGGLVYGIADGRRLFVFDPAKRAVIHEEDLSEKYGRSASQQGPRAFVTAPDGAIYLLVTKGVTKIDPATFAIELLAESPVPVISGGDYLDGRIYFINGSHLYSYTLPQPIRSAG